MSQCAYLALNYLSCPIFKKYIPKTINWNISETFHSNSSKLNEVIIAWMWLGVLFFSFSFTSFYWGCFLFNLYLTLTLFQFCWKEAWESMLGFDLPALCPSSSFDSSVRDKISFLCLSDSVSIWQILIRFRLVTHSPGLSLLLAQRKEYCAMELKTLW